jgi:acyl-[acyl-carrier-protein]-phospholipid O-acyltransferase/long-chain-fatty-acid--[acyl-carrier-protein] ligase
LAQGDCNTSPGPAGAATPTTPFYSTRFLAFLAVQFLGAANDNAFKYTLILLIVARSDEALGLQLSTLATFVFPIPFLVFSPIAGYFADRFRKSRLLIFTKSPEILAMALAIPAFESGSIPFLMLVLFLMGTQSTFFSPVKYGLLPESFDPSRLSMANGILQMTTNLAILLGSVGGWFLFGRFGDDLYKAGFVYLGVALLGTLAAAWVPRTPAGNPDARLDWRLALDAWREARGMPVLFHTLFGIAYFGFLGSLFMAVIPVYAKNTLGLSDTAAGFPLILLSVGIGAGSLIAGKLSRGRVEVGLVPLGSLGLTVAALDLGLFGDRGWTLPLGLPARAALDLALLGIAAGIYIVPLNALLQHRSPPNRKGRMIAFSNMLTFTAVIVAAALVWWLARAGFDTRQVVLVVSGLSLLVTLYILNLLPDFLVRLVLWIVTTTIYRIRVFGERNIPRGGALIVANHVSWIDFLLIGSACDRMVRFLMYRPYYEAPLLHPLFRRMHVIPISPRDTDEQKEASLRQARAEIDRGRVVCIFAEGSITRTGNLLRFRRGFERIAEGMRAPIVPVFLDGVWGSIFSYERGRLLLKRPRLPGRIRVVFGEPMPASSRAPDVRRRMQELSAEAFAARKAEQQPLPFAIVRTARRFRRRPFVDDAAGRRLTFGEALSGALALRARWFPEGDRPGGRVAIVAPNEVPAVLATLAALLAGRAVVHVDAGDGESALVEGLRSADPACIVTGDAYRESVQRAAAHLGDPRVLELPDPVPDAPLTERLKLLLLPPALAARALVGRAGDVDDTAVLVLSRPREGDGHLHAVELTHHNLLSNLESLKQVFRVSRDDRILGVLPFASPFGLVGTLLLPAVAGLRVIYHPPRPDAAAIESVAARHSLTLLPVGAAHLESWTERLRPEALAGLRHVVVAGPRLPDALRERFAERFGVTPLEGFGLPECPPLVSLNVPPPERTRLKQQGLLPGTRGHPLPGIAVRIVDPASGTAVGPGVEGVLWIRGPGVARGYLGAGDLTARLLAGGWFRSGFTASQDPDGFLTLPDA